MMKKISSLFLVVIIASIFAIPAYAAFKVNALTGDLDYYESGLTSSFITSLTERSDTSAGSLDAAVCLWNTNGTNYKMTGENFKDWLTQEGFGAGATITDLDDLPGDTVDDDHIDFAILAGAQASDTELDSIAGLTFADASVIQLTGAGASAVLTSGGNNYILGSNSDNSALEFKTPANVLTQIGAAAASHSHTGADLSGIDISDDTNLAGTANQITLTGDTLSLASAITLPGTLAGGDGITAGGITFDSTPDAAGDLGYAIGFIFHGANSETLTLLPGSASNQATLTSATGIDSLDMGDIALTVKSLTIERVAGTVGSSTWYEDPDDGDLYVKFQVSADGMTESTTYTWPKLYPTADDAILLCSSAGIMTWSTAGVGGGLANVVEDATPQLGGDLDAQTYNITGTGYIGLGADPGDSGALRLSNNTAISWEQSTPGTDIFIALDGSDILQVGQNCADIRLGTSGTGNVTVTGDLTVTGSDVSLGAAGVKITGDGDGAITLLGLGDGYDEDLTINLDDTENTAKVSTSTGVTTIDLSAIALLTTGQIRGAVDVNLISTATTLGASDCLGSYNEITAATTVTLPSVADVPVGASVCFYVRDASEQVSIYPHHDDRFVLDGTAMSDGEAVKSPSDATSAGAMISFIRDDADGWRSLGFIRTWTQATP